MVKACPRVPPQGRLSDFRPMEGSWVLEVLQISRSSHGPVFPSGVPFVVYCRENFKPTAFRCMVVCAVAWRGPNIYGEGPITHALAKRRP